MPSSRTDRSSLALAVLLAAGTAVVYARVGTFGFIPGDDFVYVAENPVVRLGLTWKGLWWAFTSLEHANWHPLTWLSHMGDVQFFGMEPGAHHRVNVAVHAVNAGFLLLLLGRLTGALWRSALVAALFAVHPLHVESVAWIAERKDLLAGFFFVLTLEVYAWHLRRPAARTFHWVTGCFALGLTTKPMLVTLPLLLLLLDHWPLGRVRPGGGTRTYLVALRPLFREKLPLLALSALAAAITLVAQSRSGAIYPVAQLPLGDRLGNAVVSCVSYLGKAIWPERLASFYPFAWTGLPAWQISCAVFFLGAMTAVALRERLRRPFLLVGWLWFLGMLVPVIGIVQVGIQALADRYTYLPLTGVFIAAVWCVPAAWTRRGARRTVAICLAFGALGTLAGITRAQAEVWRDGITLYRHTLAVTTNNAFTHMRLGQALAEQGSWDEALSHLRESFRIAPYANQAYSIGLYLESLGQSEQALEYLRSAVAIAPRYPLAHFMLGLILARRGEYEEAAAHFQEAVSQEPGFAEAQYQFGLALAQEGDLEGAVRALSLPIVLSSGFSAQAHYNLGVMLEELGRREEAEAQFREAGGRP